jgi:membrane-bound metal-dependent hydrolase YbcI (DUF457 family)
VGYASHLVMDSFTKEGVPWFLPIPFKIGFPPVRKFRVTTGKGVEALVVFPALLVIVIWLFARNYDTYVAMLHHVVH